MFKAFFISACTALATFPGSAPAQSSIDEAVSHRILPGWTQQDGTRMAGLEMTLAPGWKTYWRSPGDAGIPPHFDWTRPRNVQNVHVHWPTPKVFWEQGMRSVGYVERVVLPMTITPVRQGDDMRLRGKVHIGICSDICVPATIDVDAAIPASANTRNTGIVAALASMPYSEAEARVRSVVCQLFPTDEGLAIEARVQMPTAGGRENAVIETADPAIWVSEPETRRDGNELRLSARMVSSSDSPFVVDRSAVRITVIGSSYGVDIRGCTG